MTGANARARRRFSAVVIGVTNQTPVKRAREARESPDEAEASVSSEQSIGEADQTAVTNADSGIRAPDLRGLRRLESSLTGD